MSNGRVYETNNGWVAADDAGWTDEVYETEAEARVAVGLDVQPVTNWEGLPRSTEHRTVGEHRAWCYSDAAWCYPMSLCRCCDQLGVPEQWKGLEVGEVLTSLRAQIGELQHDELCFSVVVDNGFCDCLISTVLDLIKENSDA